MRLNLPFLAPIPVHHDVVVQWIEREKLFGGWEAGEPIVLDRTTGIVWGSVSVPETLDARAFEIERHTQTMRRPPDQPMLIARVVACQVTTRGTGENNHLATQLEIEPVPPAPFR